MLYKSDWKGNTRNKTGMATFSYGSNKISFKMNNFSDYLSLCHIITKTCEQTETVTKTNILEKVNSVILGKI